MTTASLSRTALPLDIPYIHTHTHTHTHLHYLLLLRWKHVGNTWRRSISDPRSLPEIEATNSPSRWKKISRLCLCCPSSPARHTAPHPITSPAANGPRAAAGAWRPAPAGLKPVVRPPSATCRNSSNISVGHSNECSQYVSNKQTLSEISAPVHLRCKSLIANTFLKE